MSHFRAKSFDFKGDDMLSKLYERTSELVFALNERGRREIIITRA